MQICLSCGKAPSDKLTLKPYWGKLTVRNFREGDGNVGIIRSPLRAIALPAQALKETLYCAISNRLSPREHRKSLLPVEVGMLVQLHTVGEHESLMSSGGLTVVKQEILNEHCAKTWDLCLDIIKDKALWMVAAKNGPDFVRFLRTFVAMRAAYASGHFL